jgi:hypothetical protein
MSRLPESGPGRAFYEYHALARTTAKAVIKLQAEEARWEKAEGSRNRVDQVQG